MKKSFTKFLTLMMAVIMCFGSASLLGTSNIFDVNSKATSYQVGDYIEFGSYPQSEVKDVSLISELNSQELSWISYDYFIGDGLYPGTMTSSDYMMYTDTVYDGIKYRGVIFTQYRPYYTEFTSSSDNSYQDENGYFANTIYWFKYEPIKWRVLDPKSGIVLADTCIDAQAFNNVFYHYNYNYYCDETHQHSVNDYSSSSIRKWLNEDFYYTAFDDIEKLNISTKKLDNTRLGSKYSIRYNLDSTADKVWLLSYDEVQNSAFGFSTEDSFDSAREAQSTDYAKCQGCWKSSINGYIDNADWWLRSSYLTNKVAWNVIVSGIVSGYYSVTNTTVGVRPVLKLKSKSIGAYEIIWNSDGEQTTAEYEYGSEIVKPSDPIKEGYTFKGWDAEIPSTMPANDLTFTAIWEVNTYKVKWTVDGVETVENYAYGTNIVKPSDPTKEGYTFKGWDAEIPSTMPANDLTFTAIWDENTYKVIWKVDGVETVENYAYGTNIVKPSDPTKEGYTFKGWNSEIPSTMPAENLTFTAVFELIPVITPTIKINNNPCTKTINYGEGVKFTAIATDLPESAKIAWFVNDKKAGEGESFTFSNAKSNTTITVKIIDKNGNILKASNGEEISDSETITVNAGFFQKLISFFKNLFKINRIISQSIDSKKLY